MASFLGLSPPATLGDCSGEAGTDLKDDSAVISSRRGLWLFRFNVLQSTIVHDFLAIYPPRDWLLSGDVTNAGQRAEAGTSWKCSHRRLREGLGVAR